MDLAHIAQVDTTYAAKGSITISQFEDKRPDKEKVVGKTASNSLSGQVWSGETNPEMMLFFQQALVEETERTGLFSEEGQDTYELSGHVTSMKVERNVTIFRYLGIIPLLAGILASEPGETEYLWYGLAGSLIVTSLDFPLFKATVDFQAVLTKNGEVVLDKQISIVERKRYWAMTEWGWKGVSNDAAVVLDVAITKSIGQLFEQIETEVNSGGIDVSRISSIGGSTGKSDRQ
jgi:hypothetical protein